MRIQAKRAIIINNLINKVSLFLPEVSKTLTVLRHCFAIYPYRFDTDTLKQHKKMKYSSILKYLQTFPDLCIWKAATTPISAAILCLLWKGYFLTFCRTASNRLRKLWIEISIHSRKASTDTTVCE